jgi:ribosomal protein S18 acetylase RimI-like enzyme
VAVRTASIDVYVGAAVARWGVMRHPGQLVVEEPGVRGLLPCAEEPRARLLVTDDRAYDLLAALLPGTRCGTVSVFAAAERCAELFDAAAAWTAEPVTAMICPDLQTVPAVPLPTELTLRPVRRLAGAAPDGVRLEDAAAAAVRADSRIDDSPDAFARYLRSLPHAVRLFAAVDGDGTVRATSGSGTFGTEAHVLFVNTDPGWRGRGIGRAMTAAALRAAQSSGAERACLDATDAGLSIYLRLGLEVVGRTTRFACA